jgi:hypothetical protein
MFPIFDSRVTKRHANIISVVGPMGSAGKSLVSSNLAVGLAKRGMAVALFDGDLQFGDLGLAFGCDPDGYSTLDLSNTRPDANQLEQLLLSPRNGLSVLQGVPEPSQADLISDDALVEGVTRAASVFDVVIVDTAPFWDGFTRGAAQISGMIVVLDGGPELNLRLLLESMYATDRTNLEHCIVLPNDSGFRSSTSPDSHISARAIAIPVWPVLPTLASVGSDHPKSLLVTELDPSSTLSAALRDFTEAVATKWL